MDQFAEAISLLHHRQYSASQQYPDKPPLDVVDLGKNIHMTKQNLHANSRLSAPSLTSYDSIYDSISSLATSYAYLDTTYYGL